MNDCYKCRYAYVSKEPTLITTKNGNRYYQENGGATCVLSMMPGGLKAHITITDGELKCSAYAPGNGIDIAEYERLIGGKDDRKC